MELAVGSRVEDFFPMAQLGGQRLVDRALTMFIRVVPEAVVAMAVILPTRVVQNWIEANPMQRHALLHSFKAFLANVAEP